jgi:hypothetical protein
MTLFREEWPAVNSNYVLESLFLNDGYINMYIYILYQDNLKMYTLILFRMIINLELFQN